MSLVLVAATTAPIVEPEPAVRGEQGPFENTLVIQSDGRWLRADIAERFFRARDRLSAEGIGLWVVSATRTYEEQVYLYNLYLSGRGNLAAAPGTSNHEWRDGAGGEAIDIAAPYGGRKHTVLVEEGFQRNSVEAWHYSPTGW